MTLKETLILFTPPRGLARAGALGLTSAHRCYRLGPGGRLLRAGGGTARGGLLAVDDRGFDGRGEASFLCRQLLRECAARGFGGVVCRFEGGSPLLSQTVALLDDLTARRGLALYVPERFGSHTHKARVMISSALSGGSLKERLEESVDRFGAPERVALLLEPVREQFLLPSPTGAGRALSEDELAACIRQRAPAVFFSEELCARYFTYASGSGACFVLYDDADTVGKKLSLAKRLGITRAVGELETLDGMLDDLSAMDF